MHLKFNISTKSSYSISRDKGEKVRKHKLFSGLTSVINDINPRRYEETISLAYRLLKDDEKMKQIFIKGFISIEDIEELSFDYPVVEVSIKSCQQEDFQASDEYLTPFESPFEYERLFEAVPVKESEITFFNAFSEENKECKVNIRVTETHYFLLAIARTIIAIVERNNLTSIVGDSTDDKSTRLVMSELLTDSSDILKEIITNGIITEENAEKVYSEVIKTINAEFIIP